MIFQGLSVSELVALVATLVVGLTVHEYAHARTAYSLGDPTAFLAGRLTLDPLRHIDPLGALMMLFVGFGWAKPVPIDIQRLGRRNALFVALAGPASNVLLAVFAAMLFRVGLGQSTPLVDFLVFFATLNLALAVFNSLPIAPLDGWRVLVGLVPERVAWRLESVERYSAMALILLVVMGRFGGRSILGTIIWGPVELIRGLLF